jgi:hypothetical protein
MTMFRILTTLFLAAVAAVAQPVSNPAVENSPWRTLSEAIQSNPALSLLGLLLAAFTAGFGVRKLFEDRQLSRLSVSLEETRGKLDAATEQITSIKQEAAARKDLAGHLAEGLSAEDLRVSLAEHLRHWPEAERDQILVAVVRQLLLTPGQAWLCTPESLVFIKLDYDEQMDTSKLTIKADRDLYNLKELKEHVKEEQIFFAALTDLARYGFTRVLVATRPDERLGLTVRQDLDMNWSTVKSVYKAMRDGRPTPASGHLGSRPGAR